MNVERIKAMKLASLILIFFCCSNIGSAQHYGNAALDRTKDAGNRNYHNNYKHKNVSVSVQTNNTFLVSSNILYHAVADRYVVVFGLVEENETVKSCNEAIQKRIANFKKALANLGIPKESIVVDLITQTRVYEYSLEKENIAKEELIGFEIKKNIIISYTDKSLLEQIMVAASEQEIYDLIKVDYILDNPEEIFTKLYDEALKVIAQKKELYLKITEKKHFSAPEIVSISKDIIQPFESYKNYTAHETNSITSTNYQYSRIPTKIEARKISTHYFEPLTSAQYDTVINGHFIEPGVQIIFGLQLRFQAL